VSFVQIDLQIVVTLLIVVDQLLKHLSLHSDEFDALTAFLIFDLVSIFEDVVLVEDPFGPIFLHLGLDVKLLVNLSDFGQSVFGAQFLQTEILLKISRVIVDLGQMLIKICNFFVLILFP
jgi:hypothetical protein